MKNYTEQGMCYTKSLYILQYDLTTQLFLLLSAKILLILLYKVYYQILAGLFQAVRASVFKVI